MVIPANVMIPTVAEHIVLMLILVIPVVLVEAAVLSGRHPVEYAESFSLVLRANLRSTLVGLPLGYLFALAGIIPAGLFAALLPERIGSVIGAILFQTLWHGGTIPNELDEVGFFLGTLLSMIPYFLVTLRVEWKYLIKRKAELNTPGFSVTVKIMNGITYGLLSLPFVIGATRAVIRLSSND